MSPLIIKVIFICFFLSNLFANYVVIQRWIVPRDITKEVPLRTVTSCIMECSQMNKCIATGFRKDPVLLKNDKCQSGPVEVCIDRVRYRSKFRIIEVYFDKNVIFSLLQLVHNLRKRCTAGLPIFYCS